MALNSTFSLGVGGAPCLSSSVVLHFAGVKTFAIIWLHPKFMENGIQNQSIWENKFGILRMRVLENFTRNFYCEKAVQGFQNIFGTNINLSWDWFCGVEG